MSPFLATILIYFMLVYNRKLQNINSTLLSKWIFLIDLYILLNTFNSWSICTANVAVRTFVQKPIIPIK